MISYYICDVISLSYFPFEFVFRLLFSYFFSLCLFMDIVFIIIILITVFGNVFFSELENELSQISLTLVNSGINTYALIFRSEVLIS